MAIKEYNPTTPSLRQTTTLSRDQVTGQRPEKTLSRGLNKNGGRDGQGRISVRRRGGGHKRRYRLIDFKRDKYGVAGKIAAIEYDPNRSVNIALVHYLDGEKRYILAPKDLRVGAVVQSGENVSVEVGNSLPLKAIPLGIVVHNVEMQCGRGGQIARSAGAGATLAAKDGDYVTLRLPSGESRMIFSGCRATIGRLGNEDHMNVSHGKAGRNRWLGKRPKVRGVAMNPIDHPHGGGEGRTSGGRHPVSPWGQLAKGYKTRKKRKLSDKYIVKKRKSRS